MINERTGASRKKPHSPNYLLSLFALISGLVFLSGCEYVEYPYNGPGYEITKDSPNVAPWFNVYRPADMMSVVEETGDLLPVIVWANGGCFRSDFTWQPLFKRWAAEGYVVLALNAAESGGPGELTQTNVDHHGALIDWALNESGYTDLLDSSRVISAGNSCGGITALGLTAEDPRVSGVFVLSGSSAVGSANDSVMSAINVPVGYVVGGPEDVAGANATGDYEALADGIPAMIVSRFEGAHQTVSTEVEILEEVAVISLRWMDLVLYGDADALSDLSSENVCSECTPGEWSLKSKNLDSLLQ